jgi:glutaredoxin
MSMNPKTALLLLALVALPWSVSHGQKMYKWVDPDGKVSYHDRPPPETGYRVEEKNLRAKDRSSSERRGEDEAVGKVPVVLYSASNCEACELARNYLQRRKVPFTEKDVSSDVKLQDELKKKSGGLFVPTIYIGERVMKGYMQSLLEGELDQAGYPKPEPSDAKAGADSGAPR